MGSARDAMVTLTSRPCPKQGCVVSYHKTAKEYKLLHSNRPDFERVFLRSQAPKTKFVRTQMKSNGQASVYDQLTLSGHGPRVPRRRGSARGT